MRQFPWALRAEDIAAAQEPWTVTESPWAAVAQGAGAPPLPRAATGKAAAKSQTYAGSPPFQPPSLCCILVLCCNRDHNAAVRHEGMPRRVV